MGWGMATGRAQKILRLGDYQGWLVPRAVWPWPGRLEGAGVTHASAAGGSISSAFTTAPQALLWGLQI